MRLAIMVTGPTRGIQQASNAFQFAQAPVVEGHELNSIFFYREGVYSANQLTSPASDEFGLAHGWQQSNAQHDVTLNICVTTALCRGIVDEAEVGRLGLVSSDLQPGSTLSGPGTLMEASLVCDRVVQF